MEDAYPEPALTSAPGALAAPALERDLFHGGNAVPSSCSPRRSLASTVLPPVLRPDAELSVLDISEYFGETSGGVRTYLVHKARYVEARRPELPAP
jgi:hypothetical protein